MFSATELQHLENAVTILQPFAVETTKTYAEKFLSLSSHSGEITDAVCCPIDHEISLVAKWITSSITSHIWCNGR